MILISMRGEGHYIDYPTQTKINSAMVHAVVFLQDLCRIPVKSVAESSSIKKKGIVSERSQKV
jgi:hypothetical protein